MKKLIIVVDMLNGFTKFGPLSSKNINAIIPNIKSYLILLKKSLIKIQLMEFSIWI